MKLKLSDQFPINQQLLQEGIHDLNSFLYFVQHLPYGRNSNRADLNLVLTEKKGTCSSKHGFVKKVAETNGWDTIELLIGIYKMNHHNTPKIGNTVISHNLAYIPEAHCYLKIDNQRIDITTPTASFEKVANDIIEEHSIASSQVNLFKVELHQAFIKNWITENNIPHSFKTVWAIREACIQKLSE